MGLGAAFGPISVTSAGLTTATTAYVAGDQAGTEITVATGAGASSKVWITSIVGYDDSARIQAHELVFFEGATTPAADNATASWSDADAAKQVGGGRISSSVITVEANNSTVGYAFQPFQATTDGSGNLYLDVVLRAVPSSNFFAAVGNLHWKIYGFALT